MPPMIIATAIPSESVGSSPKMTAEATMPMTGAARRPSEVVTAGRFCAATAAPQKASALPGSAL